LKFFSRFGTRIWRVFTFWFWKWRRKWTTKYRNKWK